MTNAEQELKPCFSCKQNVIYNAADELICAHIDCLNCNYSFSTEWSKDLIEVWNTRAGFDEIEELRRVKVSYERLTQGLRYMTDENYYHANNITSIKQVIAIIKHKLKVEELLK